MKKQKLKKYLYIAGLLCMSIGCKKDDPCGGQNACCGAPDQEMTYRMSIENARADVGSDYLVIEGISDAPIICYQQIEQYDGKLKTTYSNGQPPTYKYRVWGTIYNCDNCPIYIKGNAFYIQIDRIEYQN
jgi:hypothetical protein